MNGFTSSLHVKGATAKRVQQAVTDLLSAEGFQVQSIDAAEADEQPPKITRGVWVAKAKGDWVSIFCSDFMFQQEIGRELSKQLRTHALNVWVTEGSSWHYSLFENGEEVDQFDSTGGDEEIDDLLDNELDGEMDELDEDFDEDEMGDKLAASDDDEEEAGPLAEGLTKIAELQEQIAGQMPAEIKEIYDRLGEGKASLGDMRKFDEWSQDNQGELSRFQDQLQQQTAELTVAMQGMFQQLSSNEGDAGAAAQMLQSMLPPDIAQMFGRMLAGEASPQEMQRFADDLGGDDEGDLDGDLAEMTDEDDDVDEPIYYEAGVEEGEFDEDDEDDEFADEDRSMLTEEQLQVHLGALQPLLSKDVDPDELAEALTAQDEAPEEPLGEFLDLLGIEGSLAAIDFDLLEQASEEDLAEQGIKLSPLLLVRSA